MHYLKFMERLDAEGMGLDLICIAQLAVIDGSEKNITEEFGVS